MREIKFEAFIKELKIMLPDVTVYGGNGQIGIDAYVLEKLLNENGFHLSDDVIYVKGGDVVMNILSGDDWNYFSKEDYELRQFTGLKDKNGKEGYHKDILNGFGKKWVVEWQDEEARFLLMPTGDNVQSWRFPDEISRMEIIGNIYESKS